MLTYEKDIKPIKITAREAYKHAVGTEEYLNTLRDVYSDIRGNIKDGYTNAHFFYDSMSLANRVYRELLAQGYNLTLEKEKTCYHLTADWSDVDLDPNKRYILLMDDTRNGFGQVCAILHHGETSDSWTFKYVNNMSEAINFGYTVTVKDIEEAPEWVKAIEPIEVEE